MTTKIPYPLALRISLLIGIFLPVVGVQSAPQGLVPGPDVVVGDMDELVQYGASGMQMGLAMQAAVCNAGNVMVDFFPVPDTRHPIVAQNLYRMSGGSDNNGRFEQIGQAWVKHTFGAEQANVCGFGCLPGGDLNHLGAGCSDTYLSAQNATQSLLGSRAWINPFTGVFPSNARDHAGHDHTATSHRLLLESSDVNLGMNPGARYYAEVQYIAPDEAAWCQSHPGQCHMDNNVSHREFRTTSNFTFAPVGSTVRMAPAVNAWAGATINPIEPEPGLDGRAFIACKVTGPVAGVWHYEYALYNMNLDRGIQSFSVPLGGSTTVSNLGFHAPLNHPGFPNDGTQGNAGYSNAAWASNQTASGLSWSSETLAQNQNANAIRWGTLHNFRFDSNRPPVATNATIGFFKTGTPVTVAIQGPDPTNATPTPVPTVTPAATPTPPPQASPTPIPTPTAGVPARPLNLSTRMRVGPDQGDNAGIGGFILTQDFTGVLVRVLGPSLSQFGVPGVLADPILELHKPDGEIITNDNWRDDPEQIAPILGHGAPLFFEESAMFFHLPAGSYTAVVRGKNKSTGTALVEIYTFFGYAANISTRAFVHDGGDIVIGGVILGGPSFPGLPPLTGPKRIVVRGLGPSLGMLVFNPLADPTLELRNSNGALILANNNWQDDSAQAAELMALGLAPAHPLEAAMAVTLGPGSYTALLSGRNNSTGVGLVEVYDP